MAQRVTPDVLVLMLPILPLVLFTPFSWGSDGLGPGCHLYPTKCWPKATTLYIRDLSSKGHRDLFLCPDCYYYWRSRAICSFKHPDRQTVNLTIRSDQSWTCQGARVVYACVGYCASSAFPSRYSVLLASDFTHNITSVSHCCTISKAIKVKVHVECSEGHHHDNFEILTAQACCCHMCKKAHY